jgi:hypothetical protein
MLISLPIHNFKISRIFGRKTGLKLVMTSLDQDWSKDCKRPRSLVFCGPVRSFSVLERRQTGLGLSPSPQGAKNWTRPDFQALIRHEQVTNMNRWQMWTDNCKGNTPVVDEPMGVSFTTVGGILSIIYKMRGSGQLSEPVDAPVGGILRERSKDSHCQHISTYGLRHMYLKIAKSPETNLNKKGTKPQDQWLSQEAGQISK